MMDYTTLVERLLDGTITTAEQAELDRMRLSSPDIDREVRNLLEVEQLLRQKAEEENVRSLAFRESVRSTLKTSLGLSTVAQTDAQAPSAAIATTTGTAASSLRLWLIALLAVGMGAGYLSLHKAGKTPSEAPPVVIPYVEQAPEVQPVSPAAPAPAEHNTPHTAPADNTREMRDVQQPATASNIESPARNSTPAEVEGIVESANSRKTHYSALIQKMLQQLGEQEQTSRASAAVTARQIALLYDKIGDNTNTRRYFDTARRYAQEASVKETEGETLGEYALFEARNGNTTTAETLAGEALRALRDARSTKLSTWETSLQQLAK